MKPKDNNLKMKFKNFKLVDPTISEQGVIEAFVSVFGNVDSYEEVVDAGAFTESLKVRVPKGVWSHDWTQPIAATLIAEEIMPGDMRLPLAIRNFGGLYIKGQLVLEVQKAAETNALIKAGVIDEFSIGYREEETYTGDDGFRHLKKLTLYEWSPVLVGANPATILVGIKSVVPYADHGFAPEDEEWDGQEEMKACGEDMDKLKSICAWYDSDNADVMSAYKLPHHHAEGLKSVWKGVAAAMGALLGGRGGVDIPEEDRQGVYNHLAKHYKEFDKEVPEFKKLTEEELSIIEKDEAVELLSKQNKETIRTVIETLTGVLKAYEADKQVVIKVEHPDESGGSKKIPVKMLNRAVRELLALKKIQ